MNRRRSAISLRGVGVSKRTSGLLLTGQNIASGPNHINKEYVDFKLYVIQHFLNPLVNKEYSQVRNNFYQFSYITKKLNQFKNNRDVQDTAFMLKLVDILKYAATVQQSYNEAKKKLFGSDKNNTFLIETSRIILQAQYEVYNLLFGVPTKEHPYEAHLLSEIKRIIDSNPMTDFDSIRTQMSRWEYKMI